LKRIDPQLPLPKYITAGSVGFDLYLRETRTIAPGERMLLPMNLIVKIPDDHVLFLLPRSSTIKKNLISANGVGVIDTDYCGPNDELFFSVINRGLEPVTVERGERVAQALLMPVVRPELVESAEVFSEVDRGGYGSTGLK